MSETTKHAKRPDDRWYEKDPLVKGKGLGLVLHEKSGQWTVVSVLKQSPAELAGVRIDDVLVRVDDYATKGGFGFGEVCRTCNLCETAFAGFFECGKDSTDPITGRRCSSPCMIA
jgi:S1-C subfamily serine protease